MRGVVGHVALLLFMEVPCLNARNISPYLHSKTEHIRSRDVVPAPIVVPPSQYFDGVDGSWSTFNIRVGTPAQSVRVIASTNSPQTLVVRPDGCTIGAIPDGVPTNCVSSRGGTFDSDRSRSWIDQGWYGLNGGLVGYEANLGYNFNLDYGLDTLGLGYQEGDAPTLKNQTISAFNPADDLYIGLFGLGTQPLIFGIFGNYSGPSYFVTLRNQSLIPSLSWSYTAGASYQLSAGQYAQLIFGGYDTSRFQSNDVFFTIGKDVTRDLVVGVQSILYTGSTSISLLSEPIYAFIESTDPNIWLPLSACLQFEQAFGLRFDNDTQKYLMNTTQYTTLSVSNPSITFRLASSTTGGSTADIILPFKAFGLKASYPFVPNATYYFPLKRAANETQYTLGRAFLQEAYLTVDYDRGNFSVSQCTWQQSATPKIETILAPIYLANTTNNDTNPALSSHPNHESKKHTPTSAIVGSVIAVGAFVILGSISFWFWRRRRRQKNKSELPAATAAPVDLHEFKFDVAKVAGPDFEDNQSIFGRYKQDSCVSIHSPETLSSEQAIQTSQLPSTAREAHEVSGETVISEMSACESRIIFELDTSDPVEMEGSNDYERHNMPPQALETHQIAHNLNHTSSFASMASTTELIGSPVAWQSVSSRISSRLAAPITRISSIEEAKLAKAADNTPK